MSDTTSCTLLELPREIRDHILGEVLFPGEKEPQDLTQNELGLGPTAVRQIHPYNTESRSFRSSLCPFWNVSLVSTPLAPAQIERQSYVLDTFTPNDIIVHARQYERVKDCSHVLMGTQVQKLTFFCYSSGVV